MSLPPPQALGAAFEQALARGVDGASMPPRLRAATEHAVFSGGGRLRPNLCFAVFAACGGIDVQRCMPIAVAVELLHNASLVHDDLPCFDAAASRRGQPSVHRRFGEALATLAGDGLIVAAFSTLAEAQDLPHATRRDVAQAARRLVCGQAQECEASLDLHAYHAAKTGALFEVTCGSAAALAGEPAPPWRRWGQIVGAAYQLADDLADAQEDAASGHANCNAAGQKPGSLDELMHAASAQLPACRSRAPIDRWLAALAARLQPSMLASQRGAQVL